MEILNQSRRRHAGTVSKKREPSSDSRFFVSNALKELLHYNRALLVVPRLPGTDDRAVRLLLIDITTFDPDVLNRSRGLHDDRLLNDDRLGDNRLLNNHRLLNHDRLGNDGRSHDRSRHDRRSAYNGAGNGSADESTDKARPEITTSATPAAMVMMMNDRPVMPTESAEVRTGESCAASDAGDQDNDNLLVIHLFPFLQLLLTES